MRGRVCSFERRQVFAVSVHSNHSSALSRSVLLLNAHYSALRAVSARRAFTLLFKRDPADRPLAEVVSIEDGRYVSYDFSDWAQISVLKREFERAEHDWVRTVRCHIAVPRIIRVLSFAKVPKQEIRFSRRNIFARDGNTCQYCGKHFATTDLSLDHVVPRAQGGGSTWNNIVCCCLKCNVRKGGRTPAQARIKLIKDPVKPRRSPTVDVNLLDARYASWKHFLDAAYWNIDLK